jgi:hypothetical protein
VSKKSSDQQREWARLGARARLLEIKEETAAILAAFPELRRQGAGPVTAATAGGKKKRSISPAGRKKMSEGMRKYWARRKAAQKRG